MNAAATDFGSGTFVSNFRLARPAEPFPFTPPVGGSWIEPVCGGLHLSAKGRTTFAGQNIRVDFPDHPLAYLANWNFGIQREITATMVAEVAYVGSKITHLFWNRQENANDPLLLSQWGTRLNDVVPNPYFGKVTVGTSQLPDGRAEATTAAIPAIPADPGHPPAVWRRELSEHDRPLREAIFAAA